MIEKKFKVQTFSPIFIFILVFKCFFSFTHLNGIIFESSNLDLFEKTVESLDQHSFVLFDVNETLLITKDLILRPCARKILSRIVKETLENPKIIKPKNNDSKCFHDQILSQIEYELLDSKFVPLIRSLQQRNIKAIALSYMKIGNLGIIPVLEDWRLEHLKKHSIDFSHAFPLLDEIELKVCENRSALFKQGLLCTNRQSKGPVLVAFLNFINWKPNIIVYIDNDLSFLKSVEESLQCIDIPFIGFHYTANRALPCRVDERLAKFQFLHLAITGKWLSDYEVQRFYRHESSSGYHDSHGRYRSDLSKIGS